MKYELQHKTSKVGERGQVTIPKDLRTRYGVRPGQDVVFEAREEGVLIKKSVRGDPLRSLLGRVKKKLDVDRYLEQTRGPGWNDTLDVK